jgi:hypothetical protein
VSGPMDAVMASVPLSEDTIKELCRVSAANARVLESFRERLIDKIGQRTRVSTATVLEALDDEINAFVEGASAEAWTKRVT